MTLWITGARGLLGSALKDLAGSCIGTGSEVDIGSLDALRAFVKQNPHISHIVNCAAFTEVNRTETMRSEAFRANTLGPENLGRIAQEIGAKLVHISTDYVFPGDIKRPLKETDPVGPLNYYGETKLEGEKRLQKINPAACIIRTSWIFGRGGKNFVATLLKMIQEKEEIKLVDDQWGRPTYAPDLARAILKMEGASGLYQFANVGIATKFTFGCAMRDMAEQLKFPVYVKSLVAVPSATFPSPCKRPAYSVFDSSKIEAVLKTPIRTWQEALREFLCSTIC
jgi:dTDP-4-dehydrorhamnose reductase